MRGWRLTVLVAAPLLFWGGCRQDHPSNVESPGVETCVVLDQKPDWSPDGNTIAYTHRPYDIWLLDLMSMERRFLTSGWWPSWSPDGSKIAFINGSTGYGSVGIYVIDVESGRVTRLTDWGSCCLPSWAPDGGKIVYDVFSPVDSAGIWIMDSDGANKTRVMEGRNPEWSPDGQSIVFVQPIAQNAPYNELSLMRTNDSTVTQLTHNSYDDRYPSWSPDGSRIAWDSVGDGRYNPNNGIWVMDANGSGQRQLVFDGYGGGRPSWSPDGSKIVYPGYNEDSDTVTLWIMNANGTDAHPLTTP